MSSCCVYLVATHIISCSIGGKIEMKLLQIENEVDSNMKSTIGYTFVAPGAIGKGRGRGL